MIRTEAPVSSPAPSAKKSRRSPPNFIPPMEFNADNVYFDPVPKVTPQGPMHFARYVLPNAPRDSSGKPLGGSLVEISTPTMDVPYDFERNPKPTQNDHLSLSFRGMESNVELARFYDNIAKLDERVISFLVSLKPTLTRDMILGANLYDPTLKTKKKDGTPKAVPIISPVLPVHKDESNRKVMRPNGLPDYKVDCTVAGTGRFNPVTNAVEALAYPIESIRAGSVAKCGIHVIGLIQVGSSWYLMFHLMEIALKPVIAAATAQHITTDLNGADSRLAMTDDERAAIERQLTGAPPPPVMGSSQNPTVSEYAEEAAELGL